MSNFARKAALAIGAVALVATGVGAIGGLALGASLSKARPKVAWPFSSLTRSSTVMKPPDALPRGSPDSSTTRTT